MTIGDLKEQRVYVKFCFKIWKPALEMSEMKPGFLPLGPRNQTIVISVEIPFLSTSIDSEACYVEHGHVGEVFFNSEGIFYE